MASAPADIQTLMRQLNGRPCQPAKPIDHEATERLRKSREHYTAVAMRRGLKLSDPVIDAVNYAASLEIRNRGYAVKSTGLAWVGGLGCGKNAGRDLSGILLPDPSQIRPGRMQNGRSRQPGADLRE